MAFFRDSPLGQLIRLMSKDRVLLYDEEKPGFILPWQKALEDEKSSTEPTSLKQEVSAPAQRPGNGHHSRPESIESRVDDVELAKQVTLPDLPQTTDRRESKALASRTTTLSRTMTRERTLPWSVERHVTEQREEVERQQSMVNMPQRTEDGIILVDWYTTDDQENPQNWSFGKKVWVTW